MSIGEGVKDRHRTINKVLYQMLKLKKKVCYNTMRFANCIYVKGV